MTFKFEKLEVWQAALTYTDLIHSIAERLPRGEEFNLKSQIVRAATSVALNIAEGSTGQTNAEQARFLNMAIRSLIETVACLRLIQRRNYLADPTPLALADQRALALLAQLHRFRSALKPDSR